MMTRNYPPKRNRSKVEIGRDLVGRNGMRQRESAERMDADQGQQDCNERAEIEAQDAGGLIEGLSGECAPSSRVSLEVFVTTTTIDPR